MIIEPRDNLGWQIMFGFFKKKAPIYFSDKIWKTDKEKKNGLFHDISCFLEEGKKCFVFYAFSETKRLVEESLGYKGLTFSQEDEHVIFVNIQDFSRDRKTHEKLRELISDQFEIIMIEHLPIFTKEQDFFRELENFVSDSLLPYDCYMSLEDPMLKLFGSDRIARMMSNDEMIQHEMISKSIMRVQQKIEDTVDMPLRADSAKDWFRINLPR